MKPDWKECPKDDMPPQWSGIYVSMNRKSEIVMSRATYRAIGEPPAFLLLFDTVNSRIGLKPAVLSTRNAYPVRAGSIHGAKKVRACRLAREFKISLPETVRFYDADTDEDGILILDLRTARAPKSVRNHWVRKKQNAEESPATSQCR
jgi:hypothetical protein